MEEEIDDDFKGYEIEMRNGNVEYDVKIDPLSGEIVEWEEDIDD